MSKSIKVSGVKVVRVNITEPHSLNTPMLEELLRIFSHEIGPRLGCWCCRNPILKRYWRMWRS